MIVLTVDENLDLLESFDLLIEAHQTPMTKYITDEKGTRAMTLEPITCFMQKRRLGVTYYTMKKKWKYK